MVLYGFKYKNNKELNLYQNGFKKIPESKSEIFYKLKHKTSSKGEIIFEDEYHSKKYWQNFGLKLGIGLSVAFFAIVIGNSIKFEEGRLSALWYAAITMGKYFPVFMIFKALGFSKRKVFTKNKIEGKKFDEIVLTEQNGITFLLFSQNGQVIKKGFALVADDKEKTKTLIEFAEGYSEKANKVISDMTAGKKTSHNNIYSS
jgi:hypothetical protein